ncbi:MAG: cobalt transporter CbiM [Thermodesulfobacteria bacterium]|nr:cobalt transporter CbiM [Thermodesulfobacteriota bacterium]
MHISEGILSVPVLTAGALVTVTGLAIGIKRVKPADIPKVALLTAAFFVASLIHVPIGPSNAHLVLNGLLGVLLGWAAFPAIFIGLLLQAVLFQFGGLTTLGVNTANIAIPGIFFGLLARRFMSLDRPVFSAVLAGIAGGLSILGSGLLVAMSLGLSGDSFSLVSKIIFTAHVPIAVIEALVTGFIIRFLMKVKPEIIGLTFESRQPLARHMTAVTTLLFALVLVLLPTRASCHRVNVFAWFDGDKVTGTAYFSSGRPAVASKLLVRNLETGKEFELTTGSKGEFSFVPEGPGKYEIELYAGEGHKATTAVLVKPSTEGTGALDKKKPLFAASADPPLSHQDVAQGGPSNDTGAVQCKDIGKVVDRILAKRLEPIKAELQRLAMAQNRVTVKDVVAGLGYIVGIMGIWAYISSRKGG